jgi:hypothetical protein
VLRERGVAAPEPHRGRPGVAPPPPPGPRIIPSTRHACGRSRLLPPDRAATHQTGLTILG